MLRDIQGKASSIAIAVVVAAAANAGCGGQDPSAPSASTGRMTSSSTKALMLGPAGTTAIAPSYTPAAQTCSPLASGTGLASPVPSTATRVSGYRVCGPFTATSGASSFECPLRDGSAGPYRLLVYNGAADGTGRASSASVRVNGVEALGPRSFDQQISAATARVPLAASNRVDEAIADHDRALRLEVVDEGRTCAILRPTDVFAAGLQTSVSSANAFPVPELQLFNGGLDGSSPTNKGDVYFNGAELVSRHEIRNKVTAVLDPLTLARSNTLSAHAGEKGLFSVQIVDRDETPPKFTIQAPPNGSFTNKALATVSGATDDPSAIVTVNGAAAVTSGGSWSGQARLAECWNSVAVAAADVCGNESEATLRIGLDTVPPVLAILAPPPGLLTNRPVQAVSLRYSDNFSGVDPSSLRLTLDGVDVTSVLSIGADAAAGSLTLAEGRHTLHAQASDRAGNVTAQDSTFIVDLTPPVLAIVAPKDGSTASQSVSATITYGDALSGVDLATLAVTLDGQDVTRSFAAGPVSAAATLTLAAGVHQLDVQISDLATNVARARSSFTVTNTNALPPDPSTIAPPIDRTVPTDFASATAFLYSGANPVQAGVASGTIDARRVAVIRGRVKGRDGNPISGVAISILGHREFGSTLSRADGMFDMAVNGGGLVEVTYRKDGYLPAQRDVRAPWRDYAHAEDVVLVPYDSADHLS